MNITKKNNYLIFHEYLKKNKTALYRKHKKNFFLNYTRTLKNLTILLNRYHNLNYSTKDWEIIIGPWLFKISNIFFFYNSFHLNKKIKLSNKKNIKDNDLSYTIPFDFDDFYNSISNYEFFIKHFFTVNSPKLNLKYKKILEIKKKSFFKNFLNLIIKKICSEKSIIFNNLKINKIDVIKIILRNSLKFLPFYSKNNFESFTKTKKAIERKFFFLNFENFNNMEKNFVSFLMQTMPSTYLENFSIIRNYAVLNFPRSSFFLTDTSYINDDFFKINCSLSKKRNLLILQHGGNTRLYQKNLHDLVENRISKKILVWGKRKGSKKEIFFPSTRLIRFKNMTAKTSIKKYKYCLIFEPIRKFKIQFFKTNLPIENLIEIIKFLKKIKEKNFLLKLHYDREKSNYISENEILKICKIKKSHITTNFGKVLSSEIIIFNYLSTMIFELLQINKPFVVIIKNEDHFFSKLGLSFVKDLKKNKFLFRNIEEFYSYFKDIDINTWWYSQKKQNFLNKLKKEYSFTDDHSFNYTKYKI